MENLEEFDKINVIHLSMLVTKAISASMRNKSDTIPEAVDAEVVNFCQKVYDIVNGNIPDNNDTMNHMDNVSFDSIDENTKSIPHCLKCGLAKDNHNVRHPFVSIDGSWG